MGRWIKCGHSGRSILAKTFGGGVGIGGEKVDEYAAPATWLGAIPGAIAAWWHGADPTYAAYAASIPYATKYALKAGANVLERLPTDHPIVNALMRRAGLFAGSLTDPTLGGHSGSQ